MGVLFIGTLMGDIMSKLTRSPSNKGITTNRRKAATTHFIPYRKQTKYNKLLTLS